LFAIASVILLKWLLISYLHYIIIRLKYKDPIHQSKSNKISHCSYSNLITAACCIGTRIFGSQEVRRCRNDKIHKLDWLRSPWDLKTDYRGYVTSCSLETNIHSNLYVEETLCSTRCFVTVEFMKKKPDCVLCCATVWTFYIAFVHVNMW
jgi:hypothetical protein